MKLTKSKLSLDLTISPGIMVSNEVCSHRGYPHSQSQVSYRI